MKKLLTAVFAAIVTTVFSQTPNFNNVTVFGSATDDQGYEVLSVENGNYLVVGSFTDTLSILDYSVITQGSNDAFFAKFDSLGNTIWILSIGGESGEYANNIAIDSEGNYYFAGTFHSPVLYAFDTTIISCGCAEYTFILKTTPSGEFLWIRGLMGDGAFIVRDLIINSNDEVVIGGSFFNSAFMNSGTYYSNGTNDIIIAGFSKFGNENFVKTFGGSGMESINAMDVDANDNIYISGWFSNAIDFGDGLMNSNGLTDIFTAKLNASGNVVWSDFFGSTGNDEASALVVDNDENIVVSGFFSDTVSLNSETLASEGYEDVFVVKYNNLGDVLWAKSYGNNFDECGNSAAVDNQNNIYLTGRNMLDFTFGDSTISGNTYSDIFILKFDENGNELWVKAITGSRNDVGMGIHISQNNKVFVTGYIRDSAYFDSELHYGIGQNDVFVAEIFQDDFTNLIDIYSNNISLFPNPTSDFLQVISEKEISEIKIYNSIGQLQKNVTVPGKKEVTISVGSLLSGVYILQVFSGTECHSQKLVIK